MFFGRRYLLAKWSSTMSTMASLSSRCSIILAGSPGSGKTTVGKILAQRLSRVWVDIDDHVLEPVWKTSVAEKLATLGDNGFLLAESEATCQFTIPKKSVVSLTGSNPLDAKSMTHLRKFGVVFLIDSSSTSIEARLGKMKVNRIVGQSSSSSISAVLSARTPFYESCYDERIIVSDQHTPEQIADLILEALDKDERFVSTRGYFGNETFCDVVRKGVAPDGGLYLPWRIKSPWSLGQLSRLVPLNYQQRLLRVMEHFPLGGLRPTRLSGMIDQAYKTFARPDNVLPLTHLAGPLYLQETYHGPTAAFKDLALQLTPHLILASEDAATPAILVATSGDTGVAALDGFSRVDVPVVVLYPSEGVSAVQRHQMLAFQSESSLVLGVDGDFDFCQAATKDIFSNSADCRHGYRLSAGNSMNWGRLVPQISYGLNSYLDLVKSSAIIMGDSINHIVPTGNFGHILGIYMAKRFLGVPIGRIVCASNSNDVLVEFIRSGVYDLTRRSLQKTISPSVDILRSSNLERFLYLLSDGDANFTAQCYRDLRTRGRFAIPPELVTRMHSDLTAYTCSEDDCLATISSTYQFTGTLLDPHTALGVYAANQLSSSVPSVVAATAHFAKFPKAIFAALGLDVSANESVDHLLQHLEKITSRTPMHRGLRECMLRSVPDETVYMPPDVQSISNKIDMFLEGQRRRIESAARYSEYRQQ
uniref:threonine synthase n=1 Tax=Spongospora subterranea TaxID=70186 RepID=A0A0H5R610_9EUKA|eukprot:CRZ09563.1 hypothetical protein [Spongospora subterranea]